MILAAMLDLWACLRAGHHLYHTLHWQAKGPQFYGDHLLFGELYKKIEGEIDDLAELIAGHYGSDKLDPVKAWAAAGEKINMLVCAPDPITIAEMLVMSAEHACEVVSGSGEAPYPAGLDNALSGISTSHIKDLYLLKQRYGAGAPKK